MYVNGPGRTNQVKTAKGGGGRRASGGGFSLSSSSGAAQAPSTAAGQSIQGIESILALQGVEDPTAERRRAVSHSHAMLDTLEELKIALFSGDISDSQLDRLSHMVERRITTDDPDLNGVLGEIELRVRVELAKRNRFPAGA
ncbi:hypothetical protein GGD81_000843 [Rhodobium orientis]|nr:flagellar assembly protein FliX [Rhodobium orientis]MBB4301826.1 hypothetical protein [Rhodobium orientis]